MTDDQFSAFRSAIMGELIELRGAVMAELGKLTRKHDELRAVADRIASRQFEREHEEDRYRRRLKAAEGELERLSALAEGADWKRDPRDITGVHQLLDWKKQEEQRQRDSGIWWKRQRWIWAVGVAVTLVTAAMVGCAGYVATHVEVRK